MKKIWLFLLIILSPSIAHADRTGTLVADPITVGSTSNTFPSGYCDEIQGCPQAVADITARNAIPIGTTSANSRRVVGMTVYVISEDKTYRLVGGTANTDWVEVTSGGGGLSTTSIDTSAEIAAIVGDETGSGALVFGTSPTFTTPNIGTATGSITGLAGTATQLADDGTDCIAGQYPRGVDTHGNAVNCTSAASLSGWTDGGTSVYMTASTDTVGIGTTTPQAPLDVKGTISQLQSCPTDIVAFMATVKDNSYIKFPANCSYNLTTSSTIAISTGMYVDFSGASFNRLSGSNAGFITITNIDNTKKIHLKDFNCTGSFANSCVYVNQEGASVIPKENLVIEDVNFAFTPDATLTGNFYGFRMQDTGFIVKNVTGRIIGSVDTQDIWGIFQKSNSSAEANVDFVIDGWDDYVDCFGTPGFCRDLDVAYQSSVATSSATITGIVKDFYAFADGGSVGEACKQTNDNVSGTNVNVVHWINGTCKGTGADFRDGSANGDTITAYLENVDMTHGYWAFKSQADIVASGISWRGAHVWEIAFGMMNDGNADQALEAFIAQDFVKAGDTIILPPGQLEPDQSIDISKSINIKGQGGNNCATNLYPQLNSGSGDEIFKVTVDNVTFSDFCVTLPGTWSGIVADCTATTSCTNIDVKNVKIIKTTYGNAVGLNFNDAVGDFDNLSIDMASGSTSYTDVGIRLTNNASDDAAKTATLKNVVIRTYAAGISSPFILEDLGSAFVTTAKVYGSYFIADETGAGVSTGLTSDGDGSLMSVYNSYVTATDTGVLQSNSGVLNFEDSFNKPGSISGTITYAGINSVGEGLKTLSGNVGIGSSAPSAKLAVVGSGTTTAATLNLRDSALALKTTFLDNGNVGLGTATPEGKLIVRTTSDIGWTAKTGANTACNTTCVSGCVAGLDAAASTFLLCTDATSDSCLCSGSD